MTNEGGLHGGWGDGGLGEGAGSSAELRPGLADRGGRVEQDEEFAGAAAASGAAFVQHGVWGAAGAEPLVLLEQVRKRFGDKLALRDVSFEVPAGQICGLLGPNGAGKTTLFRLLMGILKATEGTVRIGGLDAFEDRVAAKRVIGFLPDEPVFYSYLSGREVLELSAAMHGLNPAATVERLTPVIRELRLMDDLDNYAEDYSRGMKKKLGLLLALLHEPRLLVLDEPTNGLDVESTHLFYALIDRVAAAGATVLFSTHLMDHVVKLCSHAVILNEGKVIAQGSIAELQAAHGGMALEELFLELTARPAQR